MGLRKGLAPEALYSSRDSGVHELRRAIEREECVHPIERYALRLARMTPEEREKSYNEARRIFLGQVTQRP